MRRVAKATLSALGLILVAPLLVGAILRGSGASPPVSRLSHEAGCHSTLHSCAPLVARKRPHLSSHLKRLRIPPPVALKIAVGYHSHYRTSAWVPARVTIRNLSLQSQQGMVTIVDQGGNSQWAAPAYSALYEEPVIVPPGDTKRVTLYLPGSDVGDEVDAQFRSAGKVVATASGSPSSFGDQSISVAAVASDPQLVSWLHRVKPRHSGITVLPLTPDALDPIPQALASFDAIVLSNADTSRLDREQLAALGQYVRDGGSLILIGGPNWQETLRPLPSSLIPGRLTGDRMLTNLSGLRSVTGEVPPHQRTIVSVLKHPRGTVLASENGVPLVVRDRVAQGRIIYLAFDPAVDGIPQWSEGGPLLTNLMMEATPQVLNRLSTGGWPSGSSTDRFGPSTMREELANVPAATSPSLVLLASLLILSLLFVGPLNFLVLHRLGVRELAWITIPAAALLCLGATLAAAHRFQGNTALLNTVSMIQLNGNGEAHPAAVYVGLFSSIHGDYHMTWNGSALPESLPPYYWDQGSPPSRSPVGLRFGEGAQTTVDFSSMDMWSTRSVALQTTVRIHGTVHSNLHVAPNGSIVGTVRNGTTLTLIRPVVIAGSSVFRISDLPPGAAEHVHLSSSAGVQLQDNFSFWSRIYSRSMRNRSWGSWDGDPWEAPAPAAEKSFSDRLVNVIERLPEARNITSSSQVVFAAWSKNHLGKFTVDGVIPQRRDLNLIVAPLSVHFSSGSFQLPPGVLGAYLVDGSAEASGCCLPPSGQQAIDLGTGGAATFEFDIPDAGRVRFQRLTLAVDAGSGDASNISQLYNWHSKQWFPVRLHAGRVRLGNPSQFISQSGALLVRLHSTRQSGDVVISNPHEALQLSGWATVQ